MRRFAAALRREGVAETAEGRQALARGREALPPYHERLVPQRHAPGGGRARVHAHASGPHRVHGRVDRVDAHPAGGHQIVDYKTGKPPGAGARRRRATTWCCGSTCSAPARPGASSRAARRSCTCSTATRAGSTPRRAPTPAAVEAVRDAAEGIAAGRFEPRPSWACRTCDFALLCPALDR